MKSSDAETYPHLTGAILAGGESRRMGQPKEGLPLPDGRTMMSHILETMLQVCRRVVILGQCSGFSIPAHDYILHFEDFHPGLGPMSGLETLLESKFDNRYLVVTCDQPFITPSLLTRLLKAQTETFCFFQSEDGKPLDPFPGIYPASALPQLKMAIQNQRYGIRDFVQQFPIEWVTLPTDLIPNMTNINTPEAFRSAFGEA